MVIGKNPIESKGDSFKSTSTPSTVRFIVL